MEPTLDFDLMPLADVTGIESVILVWDAFLVFIEPDYAPRRLYLCLLKLGSYTGPQYSAQRKGAGYKFSFTLQQVGYR